MAKFSKNDIQFVDKKSLYSGFFQLNQYQFSHPLYQGGHSELVSREVFERGHAVVVLPYDPVLDKVVLIEQLRFPASFTSNNPWLLELVAGMIEAEETHDAVARRELMEESGLEAKALHFINSYLLSPGGSTERAYFYIAIVDASQASGFHGLASEHEDIRVLCMSRKEAVQAMAEGKIDNASTLIGLQWLALNYHAYIVT